MLIMTCFHPFHLEDYIFQAKPLDSSGFWTRSKCLLPNQ